MTVPPVIVVAITALTNLAKALVLITAVVVDAEVVETAEPILNHDPAAPVNDPCNCTLPAETPAEVETAITAFWRTTTPSKTVGVADVADCAASEMTGATPRVCCSYAIEFASINPILNAPYQVAGRPETRQRLDGLATPNATRSSALKFTALLAHRLVPEESVP